MLHEGLPPCGSTDYGRMDEDVQGHGERRRSMDIGCCIVGTLRGYRSVHGGWRCFGGALFVCKRVNAARTLLGTRSDRTKATSLWGTGPSVLNKACNSE
jgi:hypothetical protein